MYIYIYINKLMYVYIYIHIVCTYMDKYTRTYIHMYTSYIFFMLYILHYFITLS